MPYEVINDIRAYSPNGYVIRTNKVPIFENITVESQRDLERVIWKELSDHVSASASRAQQPVKVDEEEMGYDIAFSVFELDDLDLTSIEGCPKTIEYQMLCTFDVNLEDRSC